MTPDVHQSVGSSANVCERIPWRVPHRTATLARMPAFPVSNSHIDVTRARPVIIETDIKVSQIASEYERSGMTPDEIVIAHPHLKLADVHAALTFFYDHVDAIREGWREAERLIADLRQVYPPRSHT